MAYSKVVETVLRSEWVGLPEAEKRRLLREGGKVVNDPPREPEPIPEGAITRAYFDKLSPAEKRNAIKLGQRVV
jgi:hypothetical protein